MGRFVQSSPLWLFSQLPNPVMPFIYVHGLDTVPVKVLFVHSLEDDLLWALKEMSTKVSNPCGLDPQHGAYSLGVSQLWPAVSTSCLRTSVLVQRSASVGPGVALLEMSSLAPCTNGSFNNQNNQLKTGLCPVPGYWDCTQPYWGRDMVAGHGGDATKLLSTDTQVPLKDSWGSSHFHFFYSFSTFADVLPLSSGRSTVSQECTQILETSLL